MMLLLSLAAAALCPVSVVKTRMEVRGEVNGGTANGVGGGDGFRYTLEVTTNTSGIMLLLSLPAAAAAAALCPVSVVNNTRMEVTTNTSGVMLLLSLPAAALCLVFVVKTRMEVGGEGGRTGRNKCWRGEWGR
ncbi:unnamed protein product [Closterium sp. NIES-53]